MLSLLFFNVYTPTFFHTKYFIGHSQLHRNDQIRNKNLIEKIPLLYKDIATNEFRTL